MNETKSEPWFKRFESNDFSQYGEDGILAEILSKIDIPSNFVVECGALNGIKDSCSRNLLLNGWKGLMIEGDITAFEKLEKNYASMPEVKCINRFISFEGEDNIEKIFKENHLPLDFGVFVLDIDGNEYHIWEVMNTYVPKIMIVEFNQTIPNDIDFVQPRNMAIQQGSSLRSITRLASSKGYQLVAVTVPNAIFVHRSVASAFEDYSNDLDMVRPTNSFETKIFQLYDGTLKLGGYTTFFWHNEPILESKIQALPRRRRIFVNGLNHNLGARKIKYIVRKSPLYPIVKFLRKNSFLRLIIK